MLFTVHRSPFTATPRTKQGYTLIELTVVVGLVSILAISITAIMLSSLLSSTQIRRLIQVKQTGDYTINQIEQLLRNAQAITTCSSANNTITFVNQDGGETTISLSDSKIASSSSQATSYFNDATIPATNFNLDCFPDDSQPNLVKISFTLTPMINSNRPLDKPQINFETSVELRNQ